VAENENSNTKPCGCGGHGRRDVLKAALAIGVAAPLTGEAMAQDAIKNARPQDGDILIHDEDTPKAGEPVAASDVEIGAPPVIAVPRDRASGVLRDGSRLNRIALVRLKPEDMSATTRDLSAQGVVGFSSICTHEGCDVLNWLEEQGGLIECPCHQSAFNPRDNGAVVTGPATRRLAALPVKIENGVVVVAGSFIGRPGVVT
jgi:rieske iron-sulfur protein